MICPACGSNNLDDAKTCKRCGKSLSDTQESKDTFEDPTKEFNKEFIYNNQTNFNTSKIDNSGGAQVPDDPELGVGFDDYYEPSNKKKRKNERTPLTSIIIFASSLVAAITIIFLLLLLFLGRNEYIHTYICSNYYENMPPKELKFDKSFKLTKDDTFTLKVDDNNSIEGNYELVEETTDGKNNRYTLNLKATKRTLGGEVKNDDYDEQYNLTFMGDDIYLESTTSEIRYICKITE